jgi:hypothetical protein
MEQNKSSTMGGNPDVLFPPQKGNAIPFSQSGKITGWSTLPESGRYVIGVMDGLLVFIEIEYCED